MSTHHPSVRSPEIYPLFQPSQFTHGLATENLPALDETKLAPAHAHNPPLDVLLVKLVIRSRALFWRERGRMLFSQAEYGVRLGQRERNGAWERRKGRRRDSAAIVLGDGIGSGVVAEDERGEEVADAGEVARDEGYARCVDEGWSAAGRAAAPLVCRAD